jgi:hypothetical protein
MPKSAATPKDVLTQPMTIHELRSHLLAAKKARRQQIASLPILEKFRIMERMKETADPIRAYRKRQNYRPQQELTADSRQRD